MIADYDVFCLRKNVLAMLYRILYEVLFQDNIANKNTGWPNCRMWLIEHLNICMRLFQAFRKIMYSFFISIAK